MKTNLFLLAFLFFCLTGFSQAEWAPVGAKWYYTAPYFDPVFYNGYGSCIYMESVKDSLIGGNSVRLLEIRSCNEDKFVARAVIRQNGDSIFYSHPETERFYLLYNFSAKVGDSIIVHGEKFHSAPGFLYPYPQEMINSFKYKIVQIDSLEISGSWHKRQKISSLDNEGWGFLDTMKPT